MAAKKPKKKVEVESEEEDEDERMDVGEVTGGRSWVRITTVV